MLESAKEELDSTGEDQIKLLMDKVDIFNFLIEKRWFNI